MAIEPHRDASPDQLPGYIGALRRRNGGRNGDRGVHGSGRLRLPGVRAPEQGRFGGDGGLGFHIWPFLGQLCRQSETADFAGHHPYREVWSKLFRDDRCRKPFLVKQLQPLDALLRPVDGGLKLRERSDDEPESRQALGRR
jgi:hypothetical protein